MNSDIWIVRDGDVYRLLHGHLHLAVELNKQGHAFVKIKDEGEVRVVRTPAGLAVECDSQRSLLRN